MKWRASTLNPWTLNSYYTSPCLFEQIRATFSFCTIIELLQTFSVQNFSFYTIVGISQVFSGQKSRVAGRNRKCWSDGGANNTASVWVLQSEKSICVETQKRKFWNENQRQKPTTKMHCSYKNPRQKPTTKSHAKTHDKTLESFTFNPIP